MISVRAVSVKEFRDAIKYCECCDGPWADKEPDVVEQRRLQVKAMRVGQALLAFDFVEDKLGQLPNAFSMVSSYWYFRPRLEQPRESDWPAFSVASCFRGSQILQTPARIFASAMINCGPLSLSSSWKVSPGSFGIG